MYTGVRGHRYTVHTTRAHGPSTRAPVNTARTDGPYVFTGVHMHLLTTREHDCAIFARYRTLYPSSRLGNTGSVNQPSLTCVHSAQFVTPNISCCALWNQRQMLALLCLYSKLIFCSVVNYKSKATPDLHSSKLTAWAGYAWKHRHLINGVI